MERATSNSLTKSRLQRRVGDSRSAPLPFIILTKTIEQVIFKDRFKNNIYLYITHPFSQGPCLSQTLYTTINVLV